MNRIFFIIGGLLIATMYTSCKDDDPDPSTKPQPLDAQVRVQVAYDATDVAFHFTWKSQRKTMPAGFANTGQYYPGHYHDILKHNGTKFDRFPSGERMDEDRVTFMIDKYDGGIPGFAKGGCAISCHANMTSHYLLTDNILDHWHWRGGRSGPMGYAEDAAVNNVERIRDNIGTAPTKFIRSGGDRLREGQAAMTGSAHAVLSEGLPRFVFNKGKSLNGNFIVPAYFITDASNNVITDPYNGIPGVKDLSENRSLLVIYQDRSFDPEEKVNAIDLAYLVWVATGEVGQLPAHLQDVGSADFTAWKNYWSAELGIASDASAQALAKLDDIYQAWIASNKNAMVTRSVGFIYNSDQHDIKSTKNYDQASNQWMVTLKRKLSSPSNRDADLSGLPAGTKYTLNFAMHDIGGAAISHNITLPVVLSKDEGSDVMAKFVDNINNVDWNTIPVYDTYYVKPSLLQDHYVYEWLSSSAHPGAGVLATTSCITCHTGAASLFTTGVLQ